MDTDANAIRDLIDRSADAWARGDGTAYGDCFTADASDVTYAGSLYRGRAEIGRAHQALFDSFLKGTRLTVEIVEIRRYGDAAVVVTRGESAKGTPRRPGKVVTYTVIREADGRWRIAAVQKTRRNRLLEAVTFGLQPGTRPAAR
ncbi:SgcJ/EcaC family oxidoreductase [Nocardia thailandica]|uniref:SgcJ/EcaC family oxidoreductase n=1 Tax=Nocardia thailandica TaxID=257275 RepID=A0ABW6PJ87_9NOCA